MEELSNRLALDFPRERFIGVVSADQDDGADDALIVLQAVLAEVIFTASSSPRSALGADLAARAIEVIGMGQDFVFTIPELSDAIRYGIDVLADERQHGWTAPPSSFSVPQ